MKLMITNATKSFQKRKVLNDVSFELEQGEIIGLFGRNGSGKSTLLKLIFGTLRADSIQIAIDGKPIAQREVIPGQWIGYLPQHTFLPQYLTARDLIPLYFQDVEILDRIFYDKAIIGFETQRIGTLSSGQRKYLELLLVANLPHPFLLLDEPFAMIDPIYVEHIKTLLKTIAKYKGVLVTDHYYKDVLAISARNFLMTNGILTTINEVAELAEKGYLPAPER